MRPANIVEKAAARPGADGSSTPRSPAPLTSGVHRVSLGRPLECDVCHAGPGARQPTGATGGSTRRSARPFPPSATTCHYPLMADAAKADVASRHATRYVMKHRSSRSPFRPATPATPTALSKSTAGLTVAQWQTGHAPPHRAHPSPPPATTATRSPRRPAHNTQSTMIVRHGPGSDGAPTAPSG